MHMFHIKYEKKAERGIRILVVGCGGAGCNSINRIKKMGIEAETLAINTDFEHLCSLNADNKLHIGERITHGYGAGGSLAVGKECAEEARDAIRRAVGRRDIVIVVAGLGGGTGTAVAPVVAEIARELGAIVVCVVTMPFRAERRRTRVAVEGLRELQARADSVIVLDNNRLLEIVPDYPIEQAFSIMDQIIVDVIMGITETVTKPSMINIDFSDLRAVLKNSGTSTILYGEGPDSEPERVVAETLRNQLLDIEYSGAKGAVIHITGGTRMSIQTAYTVMDAITQFLDPEANVIMGARVDPEFDGRIRVIAIITGVQSAMLTGKGWNNPGKCAAAIVSMGAESATGRINPIIKDVMSR